MTTQPNIPASDPTDLIRITIKLDGNVLSDAHHVLSVSVSKSVNKVPYAHVILLDGDPAKNDFPLSNEETLIPGKIIEIEAGYHNATDLIFKGIIVKHSVKARNQKPPVLVIEAKDEAVKLTIGRKNKTFSETKDSEVFEEIIDGYNLKFDVESTAEQHQEMVQYYATDWDFIVSRAEKNGMLVIPDDGKMNIKKPSINTTAALTLVYGTSVLDFEMEMDARHQFASFKGKSWDYSHQEIREARAQIIGIQQAGNISESVLAGVIGLEEFELQHGGDISEQELQAWVDAAAVKSALSKIRGRVKCAGAASIKPGDTLKLEGAGQRFSGLLFVSGIAHQFSNNGWTTDLHVGLHPEWFNKTENIIATKAAGLLPGMNGLQIGIVTDLENDPTGENRIKVKLPIINTSEEGVWSRISTLDAGKNRGSFFLPEIGDEVIVGFLNDDPRDPIVLGMLNSSDKPAPLDARNDNHEKGYVSRSEMKVVFNDDEVSLTIETPNGNKICMSDQDGSILLQDENGNKIEMSSDGITMESASNITIKAQDDQTIEALNLELKASAQLLAEGSAGTEVKSGGVTTIKGSLIQIN